MWNSGGNEDRTKRSEDGTVAESPPVVKGDLRSSLSLFRGRRGDRCPVCDSARTKQIERVRIRRTTIVRKAACGTCGLRFVAKRFRGEEVLAGHKARREFSLLTELFEKFPTCERVGVVRPLRTAGPDIFLELIDGPSLASELRRRSLTPAERNRIAEQSGEWFAAFHGIDVRCPAPIRLAERHAGLCQRWSRFARLDVVDAGLAAMEVSLEALVGLRRPSVRLHGDAKPENFAFGGEKLIGFDIGWAHHEAAEMDLAQFLVQVQIEQQIAGRQSVADEEFASTFLRGYRASRPCDEALVAWFQLYFWLSLWEDFRTVRPLRTLLWDRGFAKGLAGSLANSRRLLASGAQVG